MKWTAEQIENALGMSGVTLIGGVIAEGQGLPLDEANARLQRCVEAGQLIPDAEAYQVHEWMLRNGISTADVESVIAANVTDPVERAVALMRFQRVQRIPRNNALVQLVARAKSIDLNAVWWTILSY